MSASPYDTTRPDLRAPRAPASLLMRCRMWLAVVLSAIVMGGGAILLFVVVLVVSLAGHIAAVLALHPVTCANSRLMYVTRTDRECNSAHVIEG